MTDTSHPAGQSNLEHQSGSESLEHVLDSLNSILDHKQIGASNPPSDSETVDTVTMRHPNHRPTELINQDVIPDDLDDIDIPVLSDIIKLGETLKPETESPEIQAIINALQQELHGIVDDILIDARKYLLRASSSEQGISLEDGMKRFLHELIKRLPQ